MNLTVPMLSARLFTWIHTSKKAVTEHSTLGNVQFKRLYDDACDEGIAVYNPRTAAVVRWYVAQETRCPNGDVQVTILKPCLEGASSDTALLNWELHILNT